MKRHPARAFLASLSIQQVLLLLLVCGIILPVIVFALGLAHVTNQSLQEAQETFAWQTVQNNAQQLEHTIASISYTAAYITSDSEMQRNTAAFAHDAASPEAVFGKEDIIRFVRSVANANLYTLDPELSVIFPSGYVLNGEYGLWLEDPDPLFGAFSDGKNAVWSVPGEQTASTDLDSYWAIRKFGELVGILHIHIPGEVFWSQFSNHPLLQYRQEIYNGDTLICTNQTASAMEDQDTTDYTQALQRWGMTLTVTVPREMVTQRVEQQSALFFWFFLALIACLLVCILIISHRVSRSIRTIVTQAQRIQCGDLSPQPSPNSYAEINLLSDHLNQAAARIQELMDEAVRQARLKEKMHYEALMAQINPHFLYNTLNSIKWLATINGSEAVATMLGKLGSILHYAFQQTSGLISIGKELEFLDHYVELLQFRYGSSVSFQKQIPADLMDEPIPRFCIQPLVENALTHGLYEIQDGVVRLEIQAQGDNLHIIVSDNGQGMEQDKAERVLTQPHQSGGFNGIGVWNIQQRIQLLFGSAYGLRITSSPNCGCRVEMTIPRQGGLDAE